MVSYDISVRLILTDYKIIVIITMSYLKIKYMTNEAHLETPSQNPVHLLKELETRETDQKRNNYLRSIFIDPTDVDQFLADMDADEELDLSKKQITKLKGMLEGFKVYLKEEYLPQTGERIQRFDEKLKEVTAAFGNPEATPEELEGIGETRRRVAQAMQIAKAPRGEKGKNLREVTQKRVGAESKKELSPEEVDAFRGELKTRFDALPQLHNGVKWADVEKSLKADPESMAKLQALDANGHAMNVFGEEKGEFIFASGWDNYEKVSAEHRNIAYDLESQKLAEKNGYNPKGNAMDIAKALGVDLADPNFHEQLRKAIEVNGRAWVKTDAATRKSGYAFFGYYGGICKYYAYDYNDDGSFRAALRVKKA